MRVLFISSGNRNETGSPIIRAQAESLIQNGQSVDLFLVKGSGLTGYFKAVFQLRNIIKKKKNNYDIIHAHYSLSGFVAAIAGAKPLIVSLMGSDVHASGYSKLLILFFNRFFWRHCIVKSEDMKANLNIQEVSVIPNGVDLNIFKPINKNEAREQIGWENGHIHLLFAAQPNRSEKNYSLLEEAIKLLTEYDIEIHFLSNIEHLLIPLYLNASDVITLPSHYEGSPNTIKEAMACNRPIVTTNVGDIKWLFGATEGCYLSTFSAQDYAEKLKAAIVFSKNTGATQGRQYIQKLGLSSPDVAKRLITLYKRYGRKIT